MDDYYSDDDDEAASRRLFLCASGRAKNANPFKFKQMVDERPCYDVMKKHGRVDVRRKNKSIKTFCDLLVTVLQKSRIEFMCSLNVYERAIKFP